MEELNLTQLLQKVARGWKTLLFCTLGSAVLFLILSFGMVRTYSVKAKLAPEITSNKTSLSSLAALANYGSMNINMSNSDAIFPDLYPEIVQSPAFLIGLMDMPVSITWKKEQVNCDMMEYLTQYQKHSWMAAVMGVPARMIGAVKGIFKKEEAEEGSGSLAEMIDTTGLCHLTKSQMGAVLALKNMIDVKVDKKTYAMSLSVTAQDKVVAGELCVRIIEDLKSTITSYRTNKARKDLAYLESVHKEEQQTYYDAQARYARYLDANQGVVFQRVLTEQERLQNEMSIHYQLYMQISQQLQLQKAKVQIETPVLTVLQAPVVPIYPSSLSKAMMLVIGAFIGFILGACWVLFGKDILKAVRG